MKLYEFFLSCIVGNKGDPLFIMHPCRCYSLIIAMQQAAYKTLNIFINICYFDDNKLYNHFYGNINVKFCHFRHLTNVSYVIIAIVFPEFK